MIVVRCATNSIGSHPAWAFVVGAQPPVGRRRRGAEDRERRQFERGRVGRHVLELAADHVGDRKGDVAALVDRRHRRRGLVGEPALQQKAHDVRVLDRPTRRSARRRGRRSHGRSPSPR